jgi:hypothetical protein
MADKPDLLASKSKGLSNADGEMLTDADRYFGVWTD